MTIEYTLKRDNAIMVRLGATHWRLYNLDGSVARQGRADVFGEWPTDWDAEIAEHIAAYAAAAQDVPQYTAYLRFKDLPRGGRSRNYATGQLEDGVSCYGLEWDVLGRCWEAVGCSNPYQYILNSMRGDEVPAYIVTGERVGTGSDGEPIIRNAQIVGRARKLAGGAWVLA